jgi:recombinational DNA repair protein (RecF pathway)
VIVEPGCNISRGRNLDIVEQAEMIEPYLGIREDLQRGAYASYVAELMDRFTTTGEEDLSGLFNLLKDTFERLCIDDDPRLAVRYYEMRLLDLVGFRPELKECVISREIVLAEDQFFSYSEGGVVTPRYAHHSDDADFDAGSQAHAPAAERVQQGQVAEGPARSRRGRAHPAWLPDIPAGTQAAKRRFYPPHPALTVEPAANHAKLEGLRLRRKRRA